MKGAVPTAHDELAVLQRALDRHRSKRPRHPWENGEAESEEPERGGG